MAASTPTPAVNPANEPAKRVTEATRVPMSLPQQKLEVPQRAGYFRYWFLGKNVPRALRAGYEHVKSEDVDTPQIGLANDRNSPGSTDMGSNVSQYAGGLVEGTMEPERLYLMEIRQEWRDADVKALEERNEKIAAALRGGNDAAPNPNETPQDRARRYLKQGQDLFFPKVRKKE